MNRASDTIITPESLAWIGRKTVVQPLVIMNEKDQH
jgi:hypothetical protein